MERNAKRRVACTHLVRKLSIEHLLQRNKASSESPPEVLDEEDLVIVCEAVVMLARIAVGWGQLLVIREDRDVRETMVVLQRTVPLYLGSRTGD